MKLKATYRMIGANPFVPSIAGLARQFRYAEATVPDDSDMEQMENFAKEKTPEGFEFVKLEKVDNYGRVIL